MEEKKKNRFGHGNQADVDFQAAVLVETAHQKKRREREEKKIPENLGEVCYGCFATKTFFFKKNAFRGIKNSIFCRLQDEH